MRWQCARRVGARSRARRTWSTALSQSCSGSRWRSSRRFRTGGRGTRSGIGHRSYGAAQTTSCASQAPSTSSTTSLHSAHVLALGRERTRFWSSLLTPPHGSCGRRRRGERGEGRASPPSSLASLASQWSASVSASSSWSASRSASVRRRPRRAPPRWAGAAGDVGAVAGAVDAGAEGVGAAEGADVGRSSAPLRAAAPATMPRRRAAAQQRLERLTGTRTRGARHQSAAITAAATARRRTRWRVRTAAAGSATALPAAPSISAPLRCISFSL